MPSNRTRIDADLVQKTQYNVLPNRIAKKPCPKPRPLPKFEPLHIDDGDDHGSPNLPSNVDTHDPFKLFSLVQRIGRRKALSELSPNTTMQARDSKEWEKRKWAPRNQFWVQYLQDTVLQKGRVLVTSYRA